MVKLFLIGYRCTGKSTVGRILACKLGWPYYDTDDIIEEEMDCSIRELVTVAGWDAFRTQEKKTLRTLSQRTHGVIATGGGVVLDPENVQVMRESGLVCWLVAEPQTICRRLIMDAQSYERRPPLAGSDPCLEVGEILRQRHSYYEAAAHFKVTTEEKNPEEITREIIDLLATYNHGSLIARVE